MFDNHSPEGGLTVIANLFRKLGDSDLGQEVRRVIRDVIGAQPGSSEPEQRSQERDAGTLRPETLDRIQELDAALHPLRISLGRVEGLHGATVGFSPRLWHQRRGAIAELSPDDVTIVVLFYSDSAKRKAAPEVARILGNLPYECVGPELQASL